MTVTSDYIYKIDGCKCTSKINTIPIEEWIAAITSVKYKETVF